MSPESAGGGGAVDFSNRTPIRNSYGGNASARIHTLAIDPINANVVYTGSSGGLAKTTDGGVTWRYLSDAWASQSISSIAVNPNASNHRLCRHGRGSTHGLMVSASTARSTEGRPGTSLARLNLQGRYIRTDCHRSKRAGIAGNSCTWRTDCARFADCGVRPTAAVTWTRLRQADQPDSTEVMTWPYDLAIDPSTHPTAFMSPRTMDVSEHRFWPGPGRSIHGVLAGSRNRLSVVNSTLYLLGPRDPDHNLYKSIDRGAKWTQIPAKCFDEAYGAALRLMLVLASRCSPWIPSIQTSS